MSDKNVICRYFARTGTCKFQNCKFSHIQNARNVSAQNRSARPEKTEDELNSEKQFRAWRNSMPLGSVTIRSSYKRETFFKEARRLIEVDPGIMQAVIQQLAGESGLQCIRELVEQKFAHAPMRQTIFKMQVLPFLETVSHPKVLSSLVLEQAVGTIFNFLFGINGSRAAHFLNSIYDVLSVSNKDEASVWWLEVSLIVFSKIVDINSTAFILDSLKDQANKFQDIFISMNTIDIISSMLHHSRSHLEHLLRRLEIGSLLPTAPTDKKSKREGEKPVTSFILHQDPPGGRHNNDHTDISHIKIMPTLEEILSTRNEYLPVNDPSQWHVNGLNGLLDRNFRLLREDTVGQLRDAIHQEIKGPLQSRSRKNQLRSHVYHDARIVNLDFDTMLGFGFDVEFPQPPFLTKLSDKERETWWQLSKRLQSGALVCLIINGRSGHAVVFCTTVDQQSKHKRKDEKDTVNSLWKSPRIVLIKLMPVNATPTNLLPILNKYSDKRTFSIVEFPGILLPGFEPTLRALQKIKETGDLPFSNIIIPSHLVNSDPVDIPPPLYALRPGFRFNLRCLMNNSSDFYVRANQPVDLLDLQKNSSLDEGQAVALVNSLRHCIGLIQGPPGTGKSYTGVALIKVLLANKTQGKTNLGPILCVTYTNHALDQLLEALLDKNITSQIIRIGSQSKSERLKPFNLRNIAQGTIKTKMEKHEQWVLHSELDECEKDFIDLDLRQNAPSTRLVSYIRENYPHHHSQLFGGDEEGWEIAHRDDPAAPIRHWLKFGEQGSGKSRSLEELTSVNLFHMSRSEREALHQRWTREVIEEAHEKVIQLCSTHYRAKNQMDNVRDEAYLRCLSKADIIGVTTSGLARNLNMLRKLPSKVMLCEEAGEVLEAHILTALLPFIEHAILIGDHLQLRPQVQNYDLSRENLRGGEQYSLDVSLFERLIESESSLGLGLPFSTLETQRRMHPSIAQLVRDTLYPQLKDAGATLEYPGVVGMRRRLFWLDHRMPEAEASTNASAMATSHWNVFEIEMTIAIVNHLCSQGEYKSGEIAVLTPYLGQLHRLRQRLGQAFTITLGERDQEQLETAGFEAEAGTGGIVQKASLLQNLRVATIDNFQGEEAKVVVISLVRSNAQNRCGFLRTSNRINVLLSRAQHGMYIVGNSETSGHVPMWAHVIEILQQSNNIGEKLELQCPRHPDQPILVSEPDHFLQLSPEGGCNQRCVNRLGCGHACEQKCHSEMLHNAVYCLQPCPRPRKGCAHPCPRHCGDACPAKCMVKVYKDDRKLDCGHLIQTLPCWQDQDLSTVRCAVSVSKTVKNCKHEVKVQCHVDVDSPTYKCIVQCGALLPCGHACKRRCYECVVKDDSGDIQVDHGSCRQKCGRKHSTCAHLCTAVCHGEESCRPCQENCDVQCGHSKCTRKCCEPCTPCAEETCFSTCPHSSCSMPCSAPCNHIPCSTRCEKILKCGHQCPSVCGEKCPAVMYCQTCGSEDIKNHVVDFIMGETYKEINLDENPCIFPNCGHFLTIESMDGQMDLKQHYEVDAEGKPTAIKTASHPFSMEDTKTCATCRGPLRDLARYGRLVRRALLDESTKKFILYLNQQYVPLMQEVTQQVKLLQEAKSGRMAGWPEHIQLQGSIQGQITTMAGIMNQPPMKRWKKMLELRKRVSAYRSRVALEEQPFNRVWNMVENMIRRRRIEERFEFDSHILQTKGVILATSLSVRLDITLLTDFLAVKRQAQGNVTLQLDLQKNREECDDLINIAIHSNRILQQVEGYIFLAQLHALERSHPSTPEAAENHFKEGQLAISKARSLCTAHPNQTIGLPDEVNGAEKMLNGSTFYTTVTNEERMAIVSAMAREFHGTGHWYYCQNGHPFTIGECGGAMQQSSCPECGAPVGGAHHQTVEGVTRADDLEEAFGRMRL